MESNLLVKTGDLLLLAKVGRVFGSVSKKIVHFFESEVFAIVVCL